MNAVRIARIGIGETVAVIGLGLVGQLVSQLVRLQGGVVVAIDLRNDRVELAQKLGADHGIAGGAPLESVATQSPTAAAWIARSWRRPRNRRSVPAGAADCAAIAAASLWSARWG